MSAPFPKAPTSFSLPQRAALWLGSRLAALVIAAIGSTLRFENMAEEGVVVPTPPTSGIWCFWHQCTFLAAWHFRAFHPYVLISRSFDGELIARTLALLGYGAVRGSSSRGAVAGFLGLRAVLASGAPAIFTADGPRGPIFETKMGPVKLAQLTGCSIGSFHLQPERAWVLHSWDRFLIPKPFSRVVVSWSSPVPAPGPDASDRELDAAREELNGALERARLGATSRAAGASRVGPYVS